MAKKLFFVLFSADLLLGAFLGWSLLETHLLPTQLAWAGIAVLLLLPLLLFLLQREKQDEKKTGIRIAGIVLLLFLLILEGTMSFFLHKYNSGIEKVTEVNTQITQVEVYVSEDNPAQTVEYALENRYRVGILARMDEEAVKQTREDLEKEYGETFEIREYDTLIDLIRALDGGEIDAIMVSSAFLALVDSLPEYEGFSEKLRSLYSGTVEKEIVLKQLSEGKKEDGQIQEPLMDPALWEDSFCAYVSGIDSFGTITILGRSDVNILAVVNTETKTVLLISTPRDFYVPMNFPPANGALDKLTHAGVYGVEGSMTTLSDLYGLPIHYYLRVNFSGFIRVIDTLGGVDVVSDASWGKPGYYFREGMNHLTGEQALVFVRDRKSFLDGDRARGRHQMAVIKGVINGLKSSKIIYNYSELMDEMSECFQTNATKAMVGDLVSLTMDRRKNDWNVLTYSVNGSGNMDLAFSLGAYAYVMVPFPETVQYASELALAVASGETLTQEELLENAPKV